VDPAQNSARVSTALIRPEDGEQLWTRDADLDLDDMFGLHDAVASQIATYLDIEVAPRESARVSRLPADAYEALIKGRLALDSGYQPDVLNEAISQFSRALTMTPDLIEAHSGRAIAHLRLYHNYIDRSPARLNLAREDVRKASEIDPDSAESVFVRGYLESFIGSADSAIQLLRRASLMRPGNSEYLEALARNERRIGDYDSALANLRKAVSIDPRNATLVYETGLTEAVVGDYRTAERSFQNALSIAPTAIESRIYLAWMYVLWLGDLDAANEQLYKLQSDIGEVEFMRLFLQPGLWGFFTYTNEGIQDQLRNWDVREGGGELAAWYLAMAVAETRDKQAEAAAEYYALAAEQRRVSVAESPSDPWLTAELAIALAGAGNKDEAIAAADRLLRLAPVDDDVYNNSDFLWARATVFVMLNIQDQAITELRNAIRYPALMTPLSLQLDPAWERIFENDQFLELLSEDRSSWRSDLIARNN
ncbi:MAG: tetratricopeptide repeat protein, partial [Pseudomonadota bacterium]